MTFSWMYVYYVEAVEHVNFSWKKMTISKEEEDMDNDVHVSAY